jgi:hypothetical protein
MSGRLRRMGRKASGGRCSLPYDNLIKASNEAHFHLTNDFFDLDSGH